MTKIFFPDCLVSFRITFSFHQGLKMLSLSWKLLFNIACRSVSLVEVVNPSPSKCPLLRALVGLACILRGVIILLLWVVGLRWLEGLNRLNWLLLLLAWERLGWLNRLNWLLLLLA
jgi:hypothetical protein